MRRFSKFRAASPSTGEVAFAVSPYSQKHFGASLGGEVPSIVSADQDEFDGLRSEFDVKCETWHPACHGNDQQIGGT